MKYLFFLVPFLLFADAKSEIDKINDLLENKHTHKEEYINKNTQRLLSLEIEETMLLKKLIKFKKNLIKINVLYKNKEII